MQPKGIPAGIFFDLPAEAYHNDPAISNSNIKDLLISPLEYWENSCLNPEREREEDTDPKIIGSALHCYLMEREKFYRDYIILPKLEIDSDFYRTESQKEDFLQNFALRKTKDAKTFEYIGNKIVLSEKDFKSIKKSVDYFESQATAGELFKDGFAEVSIFWRDEETGLMCKCRPDYLATNYIADYKSLTTIDQIKPSIGSYDYYLQQAFYLEGLNQFKKDPRAMTDKCYPDFMAKLQTDHKNFIFAFQKKKSPHLVRLKTFREDVNDYGRQLFKKGLEIYKTNIEKYGIERWQDDYKRPGEPDIEMLGFEDLPGYIQYKYNYLFV